jgi:hypothetical protein
MNQSYSPWKDLSNAILIASIGVYLTSEIVKNVKPNYFQTIFKCQIW